MSERQVLANQVRILRNQTRLLGNQQKLNQIIQNQREIKANQRAILANQRKLDQVLRNQKRIEGNQGAILANQKRSLGQRWRQAFAHARGSTRNLLIQLNRGRPLSCPTSRIGYLVTDGRIREEGGCSDHAVRQWVLLHWPAHSLESYLSGFFRVTVI